MQQSNLYLLVGAPGSGKSSWVSQKKDKNSIIVSRDKIRLALLEENDRYFEKEDQVFAAFVVSIQDGLDKGYSVYADATNLNENSRCKLLNRLKLNNTNLIAVNFTTSIFDCLLRNSERTGRSKVPATAVERMYYSKTDPANDKHYTYSKIIDVNSSGVESVRCG